MERHGLCRMRHQRRGLQSADQLPWRVAEEGLCCRRDTAYGLGLVWPASETGLVALRVGGTCLSQQAAGRSRRLSLWSC
jgi:hypothetical protein